jgi:riboflavin biosynthesis pyrimidine reductase
MLKMLTQKSPVQVRTRTRTNTNPNGTEANAASRSGNARALRKQSKCGMILEGEGHWPNSSKNLQKARNLWVLRTPQNNKEEGARAKKLVTCGTRGPLGAQGAYCSAPEPGFDGTGTPSSFAEWQ